jgi:hypothetical protein
MPMPTLDTADALRCMTMTVRVKHRWITRRRLTVGLWCIRIGAKIIGVKHFHIDFHT